MIINSFALHLHSVSLWNCSNRLATCSQREVEQSIVWAQTDEFDDIQTVINSINKRAGSLFQLQRVNHPDKQLKRQHFILDDTSWCLLVNVQTGAQERFVQSSRKRNKAGACLIASLSVLLIFDWLLAHRVYGGQQGQSSRASKL